MFYPPLVPLSRRSSMPCFSPVTPHVFFYLPIPNSEILRPPVSPSLLPPLYLTTPYLGSCKWVSLHFGHLLGGLSFRLSLKTNPHCRHLAGSRTKRRGGRMLFCTWVRWCSTSFTDRCISADSSCNVKKSSEMSSTSLWRWVSISCRRSKVQGFKVSGFPASCGIQVSGTAFQCPTPRMKHHKIRYRSKSISPQRSLSTQRLSKLLPPVCPACSGGCRHRWHCRRR